MQNRKNYRLFLRSLDHTLADRVFIYTPCFLYIMSTIITARLSVRAEFISTVKVNELTTDIKVLGSRRVECAQVRQHLVCVFLCARRQVDFLLSFARGQLCNTHAPGEINKRDICCPAIRSFPKLTDIFGISHISSVIFQALPRAPH